MSYQVFIRENGTLVADKVSVAKNIFDRVKGLLGHSSLGKGEGMFIIPCNSIHTFFMRFPIDVIFVSRENEILKLIHNMPPWRITSIYRKARGVLELAGGVLSKINAAEGMHIELKKP